MLICFICSISNKKNFNRPYPQYLLMLNYLRIEFVGSLGNPNKAPPAHKLPIPFPELQRLLKGCCLVMGVPLLGFPAGFLETWVLGAPSFFLLLTQHRSFRQVSLVFLSKKFQGDRRRCGDPTYLAGNYLLLFNGFNAFTR